MLNVAEWDMTRDFERHWFRAENYNNPGKWPLLSRAWVFQERSLSVRVVHFTHDQLLWECRSMVRSEIGDFDQDLTQGKYEGRDPVLSVPFKYHFTDSGDDWHKVVVTYSNLQLTFVKDRLTALAAIVQRIMPSRPNDEYIAGMWRNTLLEDLRWTAARSATPRPLSNIPSWSWASVTGAIGYGFSDPSWKRYNEDHLNNLISRCKASVTFKAIGPPQLGNVLNAVLSLDSRSFSSFFIPTDSPLTSSEVNALKSDFGTMPLVELGSTWTIHPDYDISIISLADYEEVHTVMLSVTNERRRSQINITIKGLALRKQSGGTFKRIGWCEFKLSTGTYVRRKATMRDNLEWRYIRQFLATLPVRTYKIV